jgi:hypothetical protein
MMSICYLLSKIEDALTLTICLPVRLNPWEKIKNEPVDVLDQDTSGTTKYMFSLFSTRSVEGGGISAVPFGLAHPAC